MGRLPIALTCACAFIACSTTNNRSPEPRVDSMVRSRQYEVRITANVEEAKVLIDGQVIGKVPITRRFDEPVAISIVVQAPGYAPSKIETDADWWLHSTAARAAERFDRDSVVRHLRLRLEPVLAVGIISPFSDATVRINGKDLGTTPVAVFWKQGEEFTIQVARDGFVPFTRVIDADWWNQDGADAVLHEPLGAFVAILSARLWPIESRWTRIGTVASTWDVSSLENEELELPDAGSETQESEDSNGVAKSRPSPSGRKIRFGRGRFKQRFGDSQDYIRRDGTRVRSGFTGSPPRLATRRGTIPVRRGFGSSGRRTGIRVRGRSIPSVR